MIRKYDIATKYLIVLRYEDSGRQVESEIWMLSLRAHLNDLSGGTERT